MDILKQQEYRHLKNFNDSLTPEEKKIVRDYMVFLISTTVVLHPETFRQQLNLQSMAFIAGYRYGKKAGNVDKTSSSGFKQSEL